MDLYIMRHGIAEDQSPSGADRDRALTTEGVKKTEAIARGLKKLGLAFDLILTSPYKRTLQTARIVAEAFSSESLKEFPPLASGASPERILQSLAQVEGKLNSLLLVGHEPDLSRLISILLSGTEELNITMKKGAVCKLHCLKIGPGQGRLEWLLAPRHLVNLD